MIESVMPRRRRLSSECPGSPGLLAVLLLLSPPVASAGEEMERRLRDPAVLAMARGDDSGRERLSRMLPEHARARLAVANRRESEAWRQVRTLRDWNRLSQKRIEALRRSLGSFPPGPPPLEVTITGTNRGDGFIVENLIFESRPGLTVTANLYRPAESPASMPAILICHSHHNPRTQGELQDMGMIWARLGAIVLVMDQLGHGERRQHPFRSADDFPGSFRAGRQDYYFRYNVGLQLHLVGESLIGWMAWDLMRGVDVLRGRPGVDPDRVILIGSVAGGGDPAAVAAALDRRIAAAIPFNFGGPQPENRYPLPEDATDSFNYAGSGSWESTRNLRLSARDGFLPWVIVGSIAPRRLIYAHEFAWDRERDPVWRRLQKIHGLHGTPGHLASLHGSGRVTGRGPGHTHCNNVGPVHRQQIYPVLERWFGMPAPETEYQGRRTPEELRCRTPGASATGRWRPLHRLAAELGDARTRAFRDRLAALSPPGAGERLRREWRRLLGTPGSIEPPEEVEVRSRVVHDSGGLRVERVVLEVDEGIVLPLLLLIPVAPDGSPPRLVVGFSAAGKERLLEGRVDLVAALLEGGAAVCLPDLRGTGETRPGDGRGRQSAATAISSTEQMLGETLVGSRLRDLRSVLRYLRSRDDLDAGRVALWGDSLAGVNSRDGRLEVPLDASPFPESCEPLGGQLALLGALFEEEVRAIHLSGGLVSQASLLESPFLYVPHDAVVPGALTAGDLCDVAATLAPRWLRMEHLVDGRNTPVAGDELEAAFRVTRRAYAAAGVAYRLTIREERGSGADVATWLLDHL